MRAICPKCSEMNEPAYKNHKGGWSYLCECGHFWEIVPASFKAVMYFAINPDTGEMTKLDAPSEPRFENTTPAGAVPCPFCNKLAQTVSFNLHEMSKTCRCDHCGKSWKLPPDKQFWD